MEALKGLMAFAIERLTKVAQGHKQKLEGGPVVFGAMVQGQVQVSDPTLQSGKTSRGVKAANGS